MSVDDGDIGHLGRHADDRSIVQKIEIVGIGASGKLEAAQRIGRLRWPIVKTCIVQTESGLDQRPRHGKRSERQHQLRPARNPLQVMHASDREHDRAKARPRGQHHDNEEHQRAGVITLRAPACPGAGMR